MLDIKRKAMSFSLTFLMFLAPPMQEGSGSSHPLLPAGMFPYEEETGEIKDRSPGDILAVDEGEDIAVEERENRYEPDKKEMDLLARAVYSEARGEPLEGQVAVAAVILNRLEDEGFPNTISGVIFQPRAFTAVSDGQFWYTPNQRAYEAVEMALEGQDPSEGALYYYNPAKATSRWIFGRPVIKRIGRHLFAG